MDQKADSAHNLKENSHDDEQSKSEKKDRVDLPSELDTKMDYPDDPKVDSEISHKNKTDYTEQKVDSVASLSDLKMECKKGNRQSRPCKHLYTSTRCLQSSPFVCNKPQKQADTSATFI